MATNRADTLDPALLRPGRLDRKIEFPLPDRRQKRLVFQARLSSLFSHTQFYTSRLQRHSRGSGSEQAEALLSANSDYTQGHTCVACDGAHADGV